MIRTKFRFVIGNSLLSAGDQGHGSTRVLSGNSTFEQVRVSDGEREGQNKNTEQLIVTCAARISQRTWQQELHEPPITTSLFIRMIVVSRTNL